MLSWMTVLRNRLEVGLRLWRKLLSLHLRPLAFTRGVTIASISLILGEALLKGCMTP